MLIVCLNVAAAVPPPPLTHPPTFDDKKTDAITLYLLMVRVEVNDEMFTIQYVPPPPPPPPPLLHPPLLLYSDNVDLIKSL